MVESELPINAQLESIKEKFELALPDRIRHCRHAPQRIESGRTVHAGHHN